MTVLNWEFIQQYLPLYEKAAWLTLRLGVMGILLSIAVGLACAVIQYEKHVAPKILTPQQNPDADAYKFGYHSVGVAKVQEGKVKGVYVHHKA